MKNCDEEKREKKKCRCASAGRRGRRTVSRCRHRGPACVISRALTSKADVLLDYVLCGERARSLLFFVHGVVETEQEGAWNLEGDEGGLREKKKKKVGLLLRFVASAV